LALPVLTDKDHGSEDDGFQGHGCYKEDMRIRVKNGNSRDFAVIDKNPGGKNNQVGKQETETAKIRS
jgi:hypothetical protein